MSRISGHILTQEDFPCGRLVALDADYDEAEKIMEFRVPSHTRKSRVYGIEVDMYTAEIACPCEGFRDFREASRMPYNRNAVGRYVEHLARTKKKSLLPLVTRPPRGLCIHARKVREWLRRKGFLDYFFQREGWLIERLERIA